jgi:energy-coupling factor transporter ATP-binding protein EcfA2
MSGSLRFEELQIRRSPGFEREGFTLSGLSAGINLIHGPNGAGKSTTARAVAELLWPGVAGGARSSLRGRFQLSDVEWSVDLDGPRVQYRRAGAQADVPPLPPGDGHQRYHLSLHDLLRERDTGFAAAIAREMAGGYDVRHCGEVLEPRAPVSRRNSLNEALDSAREDYERALARQQDLLDQERGLAELREAYAGADAAQRRVVVLQAALDHAHAREREAEARAELGGYAAAMERVSGSEYEQLCRLRDNVRKLDEARREAEKIAEEAATRAGLLALPEEALREELLAGLEADLTRLEEAEREVERARSAYAKAMARRDTEAVRLRGAVDPDRLSGADLHAVTDFVTFARRANAVASRRDAAESRLRLFSGTDAGVDSGGLERGIYLLRCWLRVPDTSAASGAADDRRRLIAGISAAVVLAVLAVALIVADQLGYAALAAVAGALIAVLLWPGRGRAARADAREVHRNEYEKLGLQSPSSWESPAVEALLSALEERGVEVREAAARQRTRHELEEELAGIVKEERRIEAERERIAATLGVTLPAAGPVELAWVSETLVRWQAAHADAVAEDAALQTARLGVAELHESLRLRLAPLGYDSLVTTGELSSAIVAFRQRRMALQAAREATRNAERALARIREDRAEQEQQIQGLFEALGLDADSDETVKLWCDTRAAYRGAYERHRHAVGVLETTRGRLITHGAEEALASIPAAEIQLQIEAEGERASRRDALKDDITSTETLIQHAKRSHNVEAALERRDRAEQALRDARDRDIRGAIALELIDVLERATRDRHLPAVFRRARELFARITHGRYELRLDQQDEPEFTAFDELDRQERRLDELSSGTRVQLLLAVRVAFVEQQEQGVRLPLLLDEVLGNSDDERARAIMEAAVELAREGRQIFYFTAQADEVARWRALAAEGGAGIDLREIDLREVRTLERRLEIPRLFPIARPPLPHPEGLDHEAYGRRLGVPRLDRAEAEAAGVHLWYLTNDPLVLHRLLTLGPDRWGPLRALVRNGGRPLVDAALLQELEACGRAVEVFLEAARVGVGRRVDRAVLQDSGAVTTAFMDRVVDLAVRLEGDGVRLMESLEAGEVPRFSQKSKGALREYLAAEGYLPQEQPLEVGEIRSRVLARMATAVAAGGISLERLDRLVGRLWAGVSSVSPLEAK